MSLSRYPNSRPWVEIAEQSTPWDARDALMQALSESDGEVVLSFLGIPVVTEALVDIVVECMKDLTQEDFKRVVFCYYPDGLLKYDERHQIKLEFLTLPYVLDQIKKARLVGLVNYF